VAEFLAQGLQRGAHGGGERVGVFVPHPVEQVFRADQLAVGAHQFGEHAELLAVERDGAVAAADLVASDVEVQVAAAQDGGDPGRRPPAERGHAGDEFAERERFGKVVVGAEQESLDPAVERTPPR
jgi:hypothetical protein